MKKFYPAVLDESQKVVLPKLSFLSKKGYYLAGGTALALQLGHRTSIDFDFYTPQHFDSDELITEIKKEFGENATETLKEKDTLFVNIAGVDVSFFWYRYPLIKKTVLFEGVPLASLEDVAAMKLIAITHRPVKRDYIDIFFLLRSFNLAQLLSFVGQKYPNFNQYLALRALTYFEDIKDKEEKRPVKVLESSFSWEGAKKTIFEAVKKYQLGLLKK